MDKEDPRVRYTKKTFRDSLLELMKSRPVSEIGIKEICALAGISRSTFYLHYDNVNALLEEIEQEEFRHFEDMAKNHVFLNKKHNIQKVREIAEKNIQYIADNNRALQVLMSENGGIAFQEKFLSKRIAELQEMVQKRSDNQADKNIHECYSAFVIYGAIGLMRYWLKNNMHIPISDIAKMLVSLIYEPDSR